MLQVKKERIIEKYKKVKERKVINKKRCSLLRTIQSTIQDPMSYFWLISRTVNTNSRV